jgi:Tfp pilus assembly protein PilF
MFEASPDTRRFRPATAKDILMRFAPVALVLSAALAITASSSHSAPGEALDPRAAALEAEGRVSLSAGDVDKALDGFEAALAIQPGSNRITLDLADAARVQGMQGKALHYYRRVLTIDPHNLDALAGEGEALAEKGALEKARVNLARLESLCGKTCDVSQRLSVAIAKGAAPKMVSAADLPSKPEIKTN